MHRPDNSKYALAARTRLRWDYAAYTTGFSFYWGDMANDTNGSVPSYRTRSGAPIAQAPPSPPVWGRCAAAPLLLSWGRPAQPGALSPLWSNHYLAGIPRFEAGCV